MSTRDVNFNININTTSVSVINKIADKVDNIQTQSEKIADNLNGMSKLGNIGIRINQLSDFVGKLYDRTSEYIDANKGQQEAEAKLAQVMRNTMGATEEQFEAIKRLTAAQQSLGVVGDEVQIAGAQELSTYLSKKESLAKLLPVMNDMLAQQYGLNATQESAVNIATMLGKVMDGQVGALSRYGYRFDEIQEKILKFGTEEERVATLADVVGASVGGVNAALAATPEGKIQQLSNNFGDLKERLGGLVVQIASKLEPLLERVLTIINWIITSVSSGWPVLAGVAVGVIVAITRLNSKLIALNALQGSGTVGFGMLGVAGKLAFGAISSAIKSVPIVGWIAGAISLIIGAVTLLWKKSEGFRGLVMGIKEVIVSVFKGIGGYLSGLFAGMRNIVIYARQIIRTIRIVFVNIFSPIVEWISNIGTFIKSVLDKIVGWLGRIFNPIIELWNKVTGKVSATYKIGYEKGKNINANTSSMLRFNDVGSGIVNEASVNAGYESAENTRDAAVTGGTRSNIINITLGKMIENVVFHGSFDDNEGALQSKVEECLMRTLNAAMSVG